MTREYPKNPIFGVGAVIIKDDEVVLIKRGQAPLKGHWSLPGGAQKVGESAKEALIRETLEETGLKVTPLRLLTVVDIIERDDQGVVRHHYTVADYLCRVTGGALKAGGDAADVRWVARGKLDEMDLTTKAKEVILSAWTS
ncbi:MAG: NUDIX hydrolase [Sphingomonadales bacterium]